MLLCVRLILMLSLNRSKQENLALTVPTIFASESLLSNTSQSMTFCAQCTPHCLRFAAMHWLLGVHIGVSTTMDLECWNEELGAHRKTTLTMECSPKRPFLLNVTPQGPSKATHAPMDNLSGLEEAFGPCFELPHGVQPCLHESQCLCDHGDL